MNQKDLARYLTRDLDDTQDPAAAAGAMSDKVLAELADALYRHLDTPSPLFGAHSLYEQVTDELELRRARAGS
ncbi:hypothetical protein [Pseudarthrobacter sp. N5]|uniref:hypothetical protein n=1 Tax=Pseudarthrobacter sp. N5 TaxID=3418416 RepID=UPI003CE69E1A